VKNLTIQHRAAGHGAGLGRRLGLIGIALFALKGLVWLALAAAATGFGLR